MNITENEIDRLLKKNNPTVDRLIDLRSKRKQDKPDSMELRLFCVSVRLNAEELIALDKYRGRSRRGEALRMLSFTQLPAPVPALNAEAWQNLSKSSANLNQISHRLNAGELLEIDEIKKELELFRAALLGAKL